MGTYAVISILACSFLTSCLALFQTNNWISIFTITVIDSKMTSSSINIFSDAAYSNHAAPYMGTLEKVQSGFNSSRYSFGGMKPSSIYWSHHFNQT